MERIIYWSCSSCRIRNGNISYQSWAIPKEKIKAIVMSVRADHNRISWDCKNPEIFVSENGEIIPFSKLESIVRGLKT